MKAWTWLMMVGIVGFTACSDDPKKRPLGGVCGDDNECISGLCLMGQCMDPEADDDFDTLVNRLEAGFGSNPLNPDTDYDGVADPEELTQAATRDTDQDGVADILESQIVDADVDCLPDEFDPDNGTVASDLAAAVSAVCSKHGVCRQAIGNVRLSCTPEKKALCIYDDVPGYEADEASCDGRDNDCDGGTDEGYRDSDGDEIADCADDDLDGDGEIQADDNCPEIDNPAQEDADNDNHGDVCDPPVAPSAYTGLDQPTGDRSPSLTGTGEPLSVIHVYGDAECTSELGTGPASGAGAFDVALTLSSEGKKTLYVRAENPAGLFSDCELAGELLLDFTAPLAPTISAHASKWDETSATFVVTGLAEPGAAVSVFLGTPCTGTPAATTEADAAGQYQVELTAGIEDDSALLASAEDAAGNVSECIAGPLLFGEAQLTLVSSEGKPVAGAYVQLHDPDGGALQLLVTDDNGKVSAKVFAGCAWTVATESDEGYTRWVTVWGIAPERSVTVAQPSNNFTGETPPMPVSYTWPADLPDGTGSMYIYTPCGSEYVYSEGNSWSTNYYGDCLGAETFDAAIFAFGNHSEILAFGVARNNPVPPNANAATRVEFLAWETAMDTRSVRFEDFVTPTPAFVQLRPALGALGLPTVGDSAVVLGSATLPLMLPRIAGITTELFATVSHFAVNGIGLRGRIVPNQSGETVITEGSLPPRVLRAGVISDEDSGVYTQFGWEAEDGLAAEVDVGLFDLSFYGQSGSVDWSVVLMPRDSATLSIPTFDARFPGSSSLANIYYFNYPSVAWLDFADRDGFVDTLARCSTGLPACIQRPAAADISTCCDRGNRD